MKRIVNALARRNGAKRVYAAGILCAMPAMALAQTVTTLHSFNGTNGSEPLAGLVQATNGDFYGTASGGGANNNGTVYQMTSAGKLKTVYSFCSQSDCTDGSNPEAALIQATDGDFYGTTSAGGTENTGTVFKITAGGELTTLYRFCTQSECTDGGTPVAPVVQGKDGDFYGTTELGGTGSDGTVFKVTSNGTLTTLHNFGGTDGSYPFAGLILAADGNFYGTTYTGGAYNGGTVFKVTPGGAFTSLYNFCAQSGCADGQYPRGALVQGPDGNLYGTTEEGGADNDGTVFQIATGGTPTTLYSFCSQSGCADGRFPFAGLALGSDGNLYGTTQSNGAHQVGTIFEITTGGALTTLYSFCSKSDCTDGANPQAPLVQVTNGDFYGTTLSSANKDGVVFSLSVGLGPFVEPQTTSGKVGAAVKILGTDLTGATSVMFNGTAATFTVVSKSLITTTVPKGATTGTIEVVTPNAGTLSSNVPFRVLP
jgi:uncharacterized repeat protein (TIGR03803 family)